MIIAIDGPAGAGKSTVAKEVARRLKLLYIDTGAMYRALTLKAIFNKIDIKDEEALVAMARDSRIELKETSSSLKIYLDGREVTQQIREPRVTKFVSEISQIASLRRIMVELQRQAVRDNKGAVLEGRDIGTVVFPQADYKFYLDADFKERVRRRFKEFKALEKEISLEEVEQDILKRDYIDSTRQCAPLRKAEDAIYIDTTHMSIEEVVDKILSYINLDVDKLKN
ncbi:MAG: (d)CMP kinase [Candidatus Omnitrophica bacterium]|nr:(d)CMP kinase [Candidatus Omnitrophota bacterium]